MKGFGYWFGPERSTSSSALLGGAQRFTGRFAFAQLRAWVVCVVFATMRNPRSFKCTGKIIKKPKSDRFHKLTNVTIL